MAVARTRIRRKQQDQQAAAARKARNPYAAIWLMTGLVGMVLIVAALVFHIYARVGYRKQVKLVRGLTLLGELDDLACDYYYNEKDKKDGGQMPPEVWASFKKHAEAGDLFDAMIMTSHGAEDKVADACFYRTGRAAGGQEVKFTWGRYWYHGKPGPPPAPEMAQVQVVEGYVVIGNKQERVICFRRPIVHPKHPNLRFGRAVIVLYADAPSAEPGEAPGGPAAAEPAPEGGEAAGESSPPTTDGERTGA
jgi:hypothetical protein